MNKHVYQKAFFKTWVLMCSLATFHSDQHTALPSHGCHVNSLPWARRTCPDTSKPQLLIAGIPP